MNQLFWSTTWTWWQLLEVQSVTLEENSWMLRRIPRSANNDTLGWCLDWMACCWCPDWITAISHWRVSFPVHKNTDTLGWPSDSSVGSWYLDWTPTTFSWGWFPGSQIPMLWVNLQTRWVGVGTITQSLSLLPILSNTDLWVGPQTYQLVIDV